MALPPGRGGTGNGASVVLAAQRFLALGEHGLRGAVLGRRGHGVQAAHRGAGIVALLEGGFDGLRGVGVAEVDEARLREGVIRLLVAVGDDVGDQAAGDAVPVPPRCRWA